MGLLRGKSMKLKKLDVIDKIYIFSLISFLFRVSYNMYMRDYRKTIFELFCMSILMIILIYCKSKYKSNQKEKANIRVLSIKPILKNVPGFRTGEKTNMIIASIYYAICLFFAIMSIIFFNAKGIYSGLDGLFLPYIIFTTIESRYNQ